MAKHGYVKTVREYVAITNGSFLLFKRSSI